MKINKKKCALITGASGFIGKNLAVKLVNSGWKVGILVRSNLEIKGAISYHYSGEMQSIDQCMKDLSPDIVVHLASYYVAQHMSSDIDGLIESNLKFGAQLLETMANHSVTKLINTGTSWQNYQGKEYSPVNLYAATKEAFKHVIQYYIEAKNFSCITLKLFDTYGPGDHREKIINLLLRNRNNEFEMSPGNQQIDLVYIDDVVDSFIIAAQILLNTNTKSEVYGVSSGRVILLRELVSLLSNISGQKIKVKWSSKQYREREVMKTWSTSNRLPGWAPKIALEQGLLNTLKWIDNNKQ